MITVLFDTETTGLTAVEAAGAEKQPRIIEFAAIKLDSDLQEIDRLDLLINPQVPISDEVQKITNITPAMVADKPPLQAVFRKISGFFVGVHTLVAHNLPFDVTVCRHEWERIGKATQFPWPPNHVCTVERSMQIKGHKLNLGELHNTAFGQKFEGAHRAMVDVEALVRCYRWLVDNGHVPLAGGQRARMTSPKTKWVRKPSQEDIERFDGLHCAFLWRKLGKEWKCPSCGRRRDELIRWSEIRGRSFRARYANEHGMGFTTSVVRHHCHGSGRFPTTVICGDCNSADGAAKRALALPPTWSFSPGEIGRFVKVEPFSGRTEIALDVALSIYNSAWREE